ncbi:hypothetical protein C2G38_2199480 [Gigaspora rosea]|uniref:Protein kinase domain-containing protein n=1 Tax=Gigaspora rosea TaxID=44941 RepID=A0A397URQ1_9GLOM|nr:hypothetical protein C2G38_2199480 [Gigaspora rosea]
MLYNFKFLHGYRFEDRVSPILCCYGLTKHHISEDIEENILVIQFAEDNPTTNKLFGVVPFIAPEIFANKLFNLKSDVYSLELLCGCLLLEFYPFHNHEYNEYLV